MTDPYDKIFPPANLTDSEEDPDPRENLAEAFASQLGMPLGRPLGDVEAPLHTDVCRFDGSGGHTYMADACPHFEEYDETGRQMRPGWTVQS